MNNRTTPNAAILLQLYTAEPGAVLIVALWTLLSCAAYGCSPSAEKEPQTTEVDDTNAVDALNRDDGGSGGADTPVARLPAVLSQRVDGESCVRESSVEHGAPMDFAAYVHAADDFVVGRVDRIELVFSPLQPDHLGEIPNDECNQIRPAFDLILSDVWSARGSVASNTAIRISGITWSMWGAYPNAEDESSDSFTWSYNLGVEVPPIVPDMWIGGAVYRHADIASVWFNTMSEPLLEVVGDEVVVQGAPGRILTCAPTHYLYLEEHVVADAWNGMSVDEWRSSVAQILAESVPDADVSAARAWALNPVFGTEHEVYPAHARAYCTQRTLSNDWFCDDGVRPFICPSIDDEPCECECTTDCLMEGEICQPDNTCAAP